MYKYENSVYRLVVICCPVGRMLIKLQLSDNSHLYDKIVSAAATENQSWNHNSWLYCEGVCGGVLGVRSPQ